MTDTDRRDIYQTVTDRLIAAIEAGAGEWTMPWHVTKGSGAIPCNVASSRTYRGINVMVLWAAAQAAGYTQPIWGTYKQWQEHGAQVRKGEKAAAVVFWKLLDQAETQEDEEGQRSRCIFVRLSCVSTPPRWTATRHQPCPLPANRNGFECAEAFFAALGATIRHGSEHSDEQHNSPVPHS